ncbi:Brp/Blh family beta-carotene 15,15'-dioxygenase [Halobellus sp. EA9]|uniref:Brp/Blh family beta-carotene 15,15'-dioxygenase n=1 Tax=Halobellus sp. EA9 TaxID=3421647 RepID=UPI003EBC5A8F
MVGTGSASVSKSVSAARDPMLAIGVRPAWLAIGAITLLAVGDAFVGVASTLPAWLRYAPLAVSLGAFGLPHGAVDHLAPARATGERPTLRWLALVGLAYLLFGVGYAALWYVAPAASAAFFIGLTWFHWGQGDLYALDALGGAHLDDRAVRVGTLVVRGGLPMLVPLLRFPGRYRDVVDAWVALFGGGLDAAWLVAPETRLALGGAFAGVTAATLLLGRLRDGGDAWVRDAGETLLLWAYFLVVPPLVAVGVYFCVWHSLRHIARLVAVDPGARDAFDDRGTAAALFRVGRDAAPLTAVSIALLVGVAVVAGLDADIEALAALYLVFIAVLTLPHVAVVAWMDWAETAGLARLVREQ